LVDIIVDAEFAALCPALMTDEYTGLEASILADGCRDALAVWATGNILLDGHNRKAICDKHRLPYKVAYLRLPDRDAAIIWIITNQLGRRNLHPDAASLLRGRLYNMRKKGDGQRGPQKLDQNDPASTAERLAADLGVSAPTIKRDGKFAEAVAILESYVPDLVERVMSGELPSRQALIAAMREPETAPERLAHVSHNGGNNEWYTPTEYIVAARAVMGGIDLDPASTETANEVVGASVFYTAENNGLAHEWRGRVFMNPPYAQPLIQQFCEKMAKDVSRGHITDAIILVNNATETRWFQCIASLANAVCFPQGRVRFWSPDRESAAPLQGQAVLYLGPNASAFHEYFEPFGAVFTR